MGFLDKAKGLLRQHDDKVDKALDKAGEAAKRRFRGRSGAIDNAVNQAKKMTGTGDTTRPGGPPPAAPGTTGAAGPTPGGPAAPDARGGPGPDAPAGPGD
ncbi:MAG TPA: antitoxin, partial [Pseudonocardia sp.]|nr:antitoxin [Pseudonocardia sp.]